MTDEIDALIDRLRNQVEFYNSGGRFVAADALSSLSARVKALEEGLQPFAEKHFMGDAYVQFNPRLIERARALLSEKPA